MSYSIVKKIIGGLIIVMTGTISAILVYIVCKIKIHVNLFNQHRKLCFKVYLLSSASLPPYIYHMLLRYIQPNQTALFAINTSVTLDNQWRASKSAYVCYGSTTNYQSLFIFVLNAFGLKLNFGEMEFPTPVSYFVGNETPKTVKNDTGKIRNHFLRYR